MTINEDLVFGWFEHSKGPEDMSGVRLAYIDPTTSHFDRLLDEANKAMDTPWAMTLLHQRAFYEQKDQQYFTPDFGWWMQEDHYRTGRAGFGGVNKEKVEAQNPRLIIMYSHEEALDAAVKAGLIGGPLSSVVECCTIDATHHGEQNEN